MRIKAKRLSFINVCVGLTDKFANTAFASTKKLSNGKIDRFIIIDKHYIFKNSIELTMAIVLHEMAHLIMGHDGSNGRILEDELIADQFASQVLGDPMIVIRMLNTVINIGNSEYHPRIRNLINPRRIINPKHIFKMRSHLSEIARLLQYIKDK